MSEFISDFKSEYTNIFDSHAHYDDERYNDDRESTIDAVLNNGVCNIINIGCDLKTSEKCVEITKKYPQIYCAIGIHPHEASAVNERYSDDLAILSQEQKVVAIGEIGLDYHYDLSPRDVQNRVYEEQLILAQRLSLPVIIHAREATEDNLKLLKKYKPHGVIHSFSGSVETAKILLSLGMYIGFTGIVTFKNARKTLEAVDAIPLDRLLLETDCPYMSPEPFRGQRCRSDMIAKTAEKIALVKGVSPQELIDNATKNTRNLFNIPQ